MVCSTETESHISICPRQQKIASHRNLKALSRHYTEISVSFGINKELKKKDKTT